MTHECMIRSELVGLNLAQMKEFCSNYDCTVEHHDGNDWFLVKTQDATNLFWLGANFGAANPFPQSPLVTNRFNTAKSKG